MKTIGCIIGTYLAGILVVCLILAIPISLWAFLSWDSSVYQGAIDFFSPAKHIWVRILLIIWAVLSIIFGAFSAAVGG